MNNMSSPLRATFAPSPLDLADALTLRGGLLLAYRSLEDLAAAQPAALALVVGAILVSVALPTALLVLLVAYRCWRTERATTDFDYTRGHDLGDMHVDLESDSDEDPPPGPAAKFALPRLSLEQIVSSFPSVPRDAEDFHMTPRTRATILGQWTPRKGGTV